MSKSKLFKVGVVWKAKMNDERTYLKGTLADGVFGDFQIILFPNKSSNEKSPDFDVFISKRERQSDDFNDQPQVDGDEPPF